MGKERVGGLGRFTITVDARLELAEGGSALPRVLRVRGTYLAIALGVAAVSTAAILIRLAQAPPLVAAAYRLGIAVAVLLPLTLAIEGQRALLLPRRTLALLGLSGAALAAHFGFWIASLDYTTVASSVFLVTSNPLLVALLSAGLLREAPRPATVVGILVAFGGGALIAAPDLTAGGRAFWGDVLAILGAVAVAGYYLAGRRLRVRLPLLVYATWVYGVAFLLVTLAALLAGQPLAGHPGYTVAYLALLGIVPQLIGHSALNGALRRATATLVAAAVMAEPVVASGLAALFLGEPPLLREVLGGGAILMGVLLAALGEQPLSGASPS